MRSLRLAVVGLAVVASAALLAVAPERPAEASLGSVPVVVSDYVASGGLVTRLEELYGPGRAKGSGVDFTSATTTGPLSRVYEWTDDRYAHADSAHPIQLTNYWTVPITIADQPVGVAAVWINPRSDQPELAEFTASASLATALANVPADAALVHDAGSAAWYGVSGGTATPLVAGRSGVTTPTPVSDLALTRPQGAGGRSTVGDPNTGIGLAIGVLALLVGVIVATLVLPGRLRRRGAEADPAADAEPPSEPGPETGSGIDRRTATEEAAIAEPERPAPRTRAATARGAASAATRSSATPPSTGRAKPRSPASQKPPVSKPSGTKPVAARPPASKPPPSKPPAPRPRTRKPPPEEERGA